MSIRDLILPKHFRTDVHYWNTFNHSETETAARLLMKFFQERDRGWDLFTQEELDSWYSKDGSKFYFNYLIDVREQFSPIVKKNNKYLIQDLFISKCASNPELIL